MKGKGGARGMRRSDGALVAWLLLAAAAPDRAVLPPPAPVPLADGARDPLLDYADTTGADAAFAAALGTAVARAPEVREAVAVVAETVGVRQEVRAALRPRADVDLTAQRVISRDFSSDPDNILERSRPRERADAVLTAEQLIFDFGAARNRLRAQDARGAAARAQVELTAAETALELASQWYELWLAGSRADLADALVARHRAILADTRARAAGGTGTAGDVVRVEAYLAGADARAARAAGEVEAARLRYLEAFGVEASARPGRPVAPSVDAGGFTAVLAAARDGPAAAVVRGEVTAAERDLAAAQRERLPRLTAGLDAAKYSVFDGEVDHDVRGRLTLRQRLYGGGAASGRVAQAAARLSQRTFVAERVLGEAARDAGVAFREVGARDRAAAALRAGYVASRRTRDVYVEQFRVARGSLLELLRAESELADAAGAYLAAVAEADLARYTLVARTGGILARLGVKIGVAQP